MIDQLTSRYKVLRTLGEGGMGCVYLVEDTVMGAQLALKVLSKLAGETEEATLRFKQEFRTMTRLRHPNTVEVYDYGQMPDGTPYFTMEVVPGQGLDEMLPLDPSQAEPILIQLCHALGFIHQQGLVHCDIKPENIRIKPDGTLKLMDFGLMGASGQTADTIKGTLAYMAPEVCKRGRIDQRADLYSMGALAFHLLAGRTPFEGNTPIEVIKAHLETPPPPLQVGDSSLEKLVARLLAKEPGHRYPSTGCVLAELGVVSEDEGVVLFTSPFVGRKQELSQLISLLEESQRQRVYRAAWILGDPGIGKSRMLEELRFQVQLMDLPYFSGACYEEGSAPYGPFIEVLRQSIPQAKQRCAEVLERHLPVLATLLPEIEVERAPALEPKEEKLRLQSAITELLIAMASKCGMVLALEDWQWADQMSVELLEYIGRNLGSTPLLICGTHRDDSCPPGQKIPLGPLAEDELALMVTSILGGETEADFAGRLCELTGGNPFFTEGSLRHLVERGLLQKKAGVWTATSELSVEQLPNSVVDLLWERFRRLEPETLGLLKLMSAIGQRFKLTLLEALSGGDSLFDSLAELNEAGILVYQDGGYSFSQRQYVDALYSSLGDDEKVETHSRIALAVETVADPSKLEDLNEMARHFLKSHYLEKAVRYALEAGKANFALFALKEAQGYLEAGYKLIEQAPELTYAYTHTLGDIYRYSSELEKAEGCYREALERVPDELAENRLLTNLGLVFQIQTQYDTAKDFFERSIALAEKTSNQMEMLRAQTSLSRLSYFTGDTAEAIAICEKALALSRELGDDGHISNCLGFLGLLYVSTTPDRIMTGLEYLNESLQIKQVLGDKVGLNDSYMLMGNAQFALGQFRDSKVSFEENQRLAREIGNADEELYSYLNLALVAFEMGEFAQAIEQAETAREEGHRTGNSMCEGMALSLKAIASLFLGQTAQSLEWIEEGLAIAKEINSKYLEIMVRVYQVEIQSMMGRFLDALEAAEIATALIQETGITELEGKVVALQGEIFGRLSESVAAEAKWQQAAEIAENTHSLAVKVRANLGRGRLALVKGLPNEAIGLAGEAITVGEEIGAGYLLGEAKLLMGDALFGTDPELAAPHYRDALAIAESLGCPHLYSIAAYHLALTFGHKPEAYRYLKQAQDSLKQQLAGLPAGADEDYLALSERWLVSKGDLSYQIVPIALDGDLSTGGQARLLYLERQHQETLKQLDKLQTKVDDAQEAVDTLDTIMRFSKEINQITDFDEVLRTITRQMVETIGAERGFLLLLEDGTLKCRVSHGPDGPSLMWSYSQSIAEKVLQEGQSLYLADAMGETGMDTQKSILDLQIRTVLCVPLKVKGEAIGVLYVDRTTINDAFSHHHVVLAETLAMYASGIIETARLYAESAQHARQLEILNALAKTISTTLVLSEVLELIMNFTLRVTAADRGFILLKDDYTDLLHFSLGRDKDGRDLSLLEAKISQSICQKVVEFGESLCVVDALADQNLQMQASIMALNLRTVMCVPLQVKNECLGVLYVDSQAVVNTFTQKDLDLLKSIASHASMAIENARLYEKATVDGLTKLYFRSYFESRMAAEIRRTTRFKKPLSLVMMDIDHFKKFNDTYGHQTGDEVLKLVAQVIRDQVRKEIDIPARYGGEEMLVLMPETPPDGAMIAAERLREAIETTDLRGPNDEVLHVTVSMGVATIPMHADAATQLIERADLALYSSKHNGRNQVTLYHDELSQ